MGEFLHSLALVFRRGVEVAHSHLDLRMLCQFPQRGQVNTRHRHARQSGVAELVETEARFDSTALDGLVMGFANLAEGL